jgi:hypothetical protein
MTLTNLLEEVYALGFEDSAELDENFLITANRALMHIFSEKCEEKLGKMIATGIDTLSYISSYIHRPGTDVTFSIPGVAYSFRVSGKGSYKIKDKNGERTESFDTVMGQRRGFISSDASITFLGEYTYTVIGLASFPYTSGEDVTDIPIFTKEKEYKISDVIADFLAFTRMPTDKDGYEISGARICADTLYLPSDFKGEVNILYKRKPEALCIDYPDAEIDIPRSTENLLPLLVASYLWLDDDPDKAQYYMQLYRDEMARLKRYIPSVIGGGYQDVTGWA